MTPDPFSFPSREAALAALESAIAERLDQGGLVALEIGRETAYHERDADVRE